MRLVTQHHCHTNGKFAIQMPSCCCFASHYRFAFRSVVKSFLFWVEVAYMRIDAIMSATRKTDKANHRRVSGPQHIL